MNRPLPLCCRNSTPAAAKRKKTNPQAIEIDSIPASWHNIGRLAKDEKKLLRAAWQPHVRWGDTSVCWYCKAHKWISANVSRDVKLLKPRTLPSSRNSLASSRESKSVSALITQPGRPSLSSKSYRCSHVSRGIEKMNRNTQIVVSCSCLNFRLKVVYLIELSCQNVAVTNISTSCKVALIVVKAFCMVTLPDVSIFCAVALSDVGSL